MQWWYGHNAVAFFLTTPFLGLMYYFLPKAAERPVFSYRLSILHFWSLVFIYIWAGPHHLHYTALPEWASTLGMVFSVMLWMPSWGGMINGLLTLRGAWHKVAEDPVLKFFVVGVTVLRHVHLRRPDALDQERQRAVALHRLDHRARPRRRPRLDRLHDVRHDLLAGAAAVPDQAVQQEARRDRTSGSAPSASCSTSSPIYAAGITQGLMWRAFDETGRLPYPDFVETVDAAHADVLGARGRAARSTSPAWSCSWLQHASGPGRRRPAAYEEPERPGRRRWPRTSRRAEPARRTTAGALATVRSSAAPAGTATGSGCR